MFTRNFTFIIGLTSLLSACSSYTPDISIVCMRDDIGNYILKWETNPQIEGTLKIYASDDPSRFNKSTPVAYANISDGITTYITDNNITRKYFLLSFNDKYYRTIGSRSVLMDSVQNLRDLGGYKVRQNEKRTRWGKVFRSGKVSSLGDRDTLRLDILNIKTIIDLRTNEEVAVSPVRYKKANVIHIPVALGNLEEVNERIREKRIRKGDGVLFMQDLYLQFATANSEQFGKALDVFLDENNYPILFNCTLGKDRVGFMAAILLLSLGVPEDVVMRDYMETNNFIDLAPYQTHVREMDSNAQETLTVVLTANESFLNLALRRIEKEYGSFSKYLSKELNIHEKQQDRLKEILLF